MRGWSSLIVGMLLGLALVPAAVGADDRSPSVIRFYRVLAPEDRMSQWPPGGGKRLPVDAQEFERLVAAMKTPASEKSATPSAAIAAGEYEAKLVGERLIGRAKLDIALAAATPVRLPFAPCNLAIDKAAWDLPASPLPKEEGKSTAERASLGSGIDGRLGLFVDRAGQLNFAWSAAGRRESGDAIEFSLEMPTAPANRLVIDLPNGLAPTVDRGLVVGGEPAGAEACRWRIELGGHDHLRLRIAAANAPHPRRQLALLRESRTYDCSLRGLEVSTQWKLQVYNEPLVQVSTLLDPELQLVSARLGDKAIPWSVSPAADGAGTRITLRLPEAIRDTDRVIRLSAVGRPAVGRSWRLPRIRAEGLLWQEGSIALLTPDPLAADRIVLHNCVQTGTGSLSAPRTGQAMQFQSFDRDATVEVLLSRAPAKVEMIEGTAIELDGEEAAARVSAQFRVMGDSIFAVGADVAPQWIVTAVESVPAGGVADWSIEPGADGRQRLAIRLRAALSPQQPLQLAIAARRLFASSDRLEKIDLPPITFCGIGSSKRLVAVQPIGSFALKLQGDARLNRLVPDDLTPSDAALFAAKPADLLFECNARSAPLMISLVGREASYAGAIAVDATLGDRTLHEKYVLSCVPKSGRVDRVLVRLYPRRDASPRWTLSSSGGNDGGVDARPVAFFAEPKPLETPDDRVSARRWSSDEEAAAGVDLSLETWELTLHHPRVDAFEITGSRELVVSSLPVIASLASLPEATEQRGTVVIHSVRTGGVSVDSRRLKAVLPEPPPAGEEQTIRGAYRYDPMQDIADVTNAAIRIGRADKSAGPSAWIKNCRLESWYQTDGTTRHVAAYEVENSACSSFKLTIPSGDLQGVCVDGVPTAWQTSGKPVAALHSSSEASESSPQLSVDIPARRKSLCVTVEWTTKGPALGVVGSLDAAMPQPNLPVLAQSWTAWLPPGYRNIDSAAEQPSEVSLGWTSRCVEVSAATPAALRYARVASMRLLAAVIFLLAAGAGCWSASRRIADHAACVALLGAFGAAVVLLPGVYAPIALAGALGIVVCLTLRWIRRDSTKMQWPIPDGEKAANLNPGSTVAMDIRIGSLLLAALLMPLASGTASAADPSSQTKKSRDIGREEQAADAKPSQTASGKTTPDKSASPASPPVYRVFVPVDANRKPVGGKVYVPEAFYQELYRHSVETADKPPAWLIVGAAYRGELAKELVSGRLAIDAIRAQYDLRVFDRSTRVRILLPADGASLLPGTVRLDGHAIEPGSEGNAAVLAFDVPEPGDYRLEYALRPLVRGSGGSNGIDVAIPRVAGASLELTVPPDAPPIEVPSACGGISSEKEPQRVAAELGPADRLTVRWQDSAAAGGARLAVDADQLTWLKIQPGSVLIAARFKLRVAEGQLRQVQLAVDSRLRLLPLLGDDPPTVQVGNETGQTRLITIRWPRPVTDKTVLDATFLFSGASAVGNIRVPQIDLLDVQTTQRWMAVNVDPALDSEEQQGERLESVAVADFVKAWGNADSNPRAAYRLAVGESGWLLSTRPHEPSTTADQTLSLSFDEDRVDVLLDARLSVASGYVFQHRLTVPKRLKIEQVSVKQDDVDRVQRWLRDDGGVTVFLNGPVSGAERFEIRGHIPIRLGEKIEVPTVRIDKSQIRSATIQLYRRHAVSLSIEGSSAVADSTKKKSELGRLVKSIVWDGVQRLPVVVVARSNRAKDATRSSTSSRGTAKPSNVPPKHAAVPPVSFVRSADVTLSRQADGAWCGTATLDIEPGGVEELDLRLPGAGELIRASVEDMPLAAKPIGDGVWRLRLASADVRQRIDIIFRGVAAEADRAGRIRFESPTLGDLPVRQTFWTLLLPSSWRVGESDGAESVEDATLPLPRSKITLGVGKSQTARFYVSGEGVTGFALVYREARSHRWPAAAVLLLLGIASASVLTIGKRRKANRQ